MMSFRQYFKEIKYLLALKSVFSITSGLIPYVMSRAIIDIVNNITAKSIDVGKLIPCFLILTIAVFWERMEVTLKMPVDTLFEVRCKEFVERTSCEMVRDTDYESIESAEFREQYSHIARYVDRVSQLWDKVLSVITTLIQFVSLTALICGIRWYVALLLFFGVLPIWIEYRKRASENNRFEKDIQLSNNKINYYYDVLTNGYFLKEGNVFNSLWEIKNRWRELKTKTIGQSYKYRERRLLRELFYRVIQYISFIVSIVLLIIAIFRNRLDVGSTIGMFSVMQTYQGNIARLFFTFSEFKEIKQNYLEIKSFNKRYEFSKEKQPGAQDYHINSEIEFKNVYYQYKNKNDFALSGVNVSIKKGETVFVVGMNGSGKSTFIKLLTGLYKPTKGQILYDGNDREEIGNIYSNFTVLFQDYSKFPFTINDNVSLGKVSESNENDVNTILNKVGIDDFVKGLPDKGETYLGKIKKGSINLSEGQWQKIALSRALYRNSDYYIFDEPTSSLDPLAESQIFELYSQIPENKTKIIISHRLGYAKYADSIILFQNGTIAEQGSFSDLLSRKGLFFKMYETQKELSLGEG